MLCYRCGSHVQDGAGKCWNCGTQLATGAPKKASSTMEIRAGQRTGSRVFGVVFKIGDLIANRYRVSDIIGSGGAGVVYRAHDQEIDVDVAVKVINAKLVQTADEQRLFSRQTKIARKLSHQNVVRIYDEGRDEDRPFYTMQFLEGLSLRKIIDLRKEKQQTFALAEVEPIYNQLCQALDYAHKTTFHGDLKPDNVIVLPDLLKVTDFALLRGLPRKPFLAIQKSRAQNFRYLAPEVRLEVNELDRQVDVYSLGVILCEMLTGLVFDDGKPEQLSVTGTGIDTAILGIIKRAVARAPKDRYASCAELYEDLRAAAAKGGTARSNVRVPPTSGEPPHLAELPTQRLDISRHGARPIPDPAPKSQSSSPPPDEDTNDLRPKAVEVAASLAVPDAPSVAHHEEASGPFATIDDDMIESASPSSLEASAKAVAAAPGRGDPGRTLEDTDDDGATEALLPDAAPGATEAVVQELIEISNSAIELIADPRATNLIEIEPSTGEVRYRGKPSEERSNVRVRDEAVETPSSINQTMQPTPLPDSALPQPAFATAASAREATAFGRLDVPDDAPAEPQLPEPKNLFAQAAQSAAARSADQPPKEPPAVAAAAVSDGPKMIPRSPTLAMDPPPPSTTPKNGKAKARPMTRPRMSAIGASSALPSTTSAAASAGSPLTSGALFEQTPSPEILRQPTGARPLMIDGSSIRPAGTGIPQPVAVEAPKANKSLILTIAASVAAVIVALFVIFRMQSAEQAKQISELQQQISAMQNLADSAKEKEATARKEVERSAAAADEAGKAEAEAALAAKTADEKRLAAEAEAKTRDEEAQRLRDEAAKAQDAERKAEREKAALAAAEAAAERRKTAEAEAQKVKDENARAETERKRREKEEAAKKLAEERAERERLAKLEAEEKASRLKAEREAAAAEKAEQAALARAAAEEQKRLEADRMAEERRLKEEADAKRREEEAAKKKAESEAATTAAAITPAGKECPKGMVLVEDGAFMMGAPGNDPERNFGDLPYASVDVKAFCVDYYEFPNGRDRVPNENVSFKTAQQSCKAKNKRLCTEAEWEKACKGPSGSRFPYGNQWDPTACATEDDEGNKRQVARSGEFKRCRSGYNVFDLSGNVAEWTATEYGAGGYVVKGGAADRPGYDARCAARKKKKASDADALLGFRCCADPR
ncbi:protein kinase [Myxococcota bacterium]|nr:protein kinase [Myxococcota bacterium]